MSKKKRHTSQPRFHPMKRAARLSNAQAWLPKYDGKNVVRGYRKRYGVDLLCAIAELQMLSARLGMRLSMSEQRNATHTGGSHETWARWCMYWT